MIKKSHLNGIVNVARRVYTRRCGNNNKKRMLQKM